jgi:hypothetical protein
VTATHDTSGAPPANEDATGRQVMVVEDGPFCVGSRHASSWRPATPSMRRRTVWALDFVRAAPVVAAQTASRHGVVHSGTTVVFTLALRWPLRLLEPGPAVRPVTYFPAPLP